jgi:plastocyanin
LIRSPYAALFPAIVLVGAAVLGCGKRADSGSARPAGSAGVAESSAGVTIEILSGSSYRGSMSYSPDPVEVKIGQEIRWVNRDSVDHTASQTPTGFDTGVLLPGETSDPIAMTEAGTLTYTCVVSGHRMSGTLVVKP